MSAPSPARIARLITIIEDCGSPAEVEAVRSQVAAQGELTADVLRAVRDRLQALGVRA